MNLFAVTALILLLVKWAAQLWLERLNRQYVLAHSDTVPDAFKGSVDAATYAKSLQYTLAKSRLGQIETTCDLAILVAVLYSGLLPWAFDWFTGRNGSSAWAVAAFLFLTGLLLALSALPFDWHAQFRLEERFGFNNTTPKLWWTDRLKGLLLSVALGYPLLVVILKLVEWIPEWWWLCAWSCVLGFQLLMVLLAPVLIMPLFNKFTPLPDGSLRDRLLALGSRAGFQAKSIQVMDGSRRSRHSNAFFTGLGRLRKIVLFDTLIQQLTEPELEAVLAHEIGHYKKKHIAKMLLWSAVSLLVAFYLIAQLAKQEWFYQAFGFKSGSIGPALLLFALLSSVVTFWLSPLARWWSRKYEYEADRYAAETTGDAADLIAALRKLNEKNLSNLTPHPLYSGFYYSHPTLLERERALATVTSGSLGAVTDMDFKL